MAESKPTARIRTQPEDFVVEELPAYSPCGSGEHLYVTFRKRGLDTLEAVRRLARVLEVSPRDAGTAGLKDRHAVTVQTASFPFPLARPLPEAGSLGGEGLEVLSLARHNNKLRTGHLRGNRFGLVLRGIDPSQVRAVCEAFARLGEAGLPNRYGAQRFGRFGDNAEAARAWMTGKARPPRDQRVRRLQFSALQSDLFNRVLDRRVADGTWDRVLSGDLMVKAHSARPVLCEDPKAVEAEVARGEVSATGPMFGARMPWPSGAPGELERAVLLEAVGDPGLFDQHRSLGEGARRALRLSPEGMKAEAISTEAGSVHVEFVLPKGAYATAVLDEVCVVVDVTRPPPGSESGRGAIEDEGEPEPTGKEETS